MKQTVAKQPLDVAVNATCGDARQICKTPGARVFWRPGGAINWMEPDLDLAQVLTAS